MSFLETIISQLKIYEPARAFQDKVKRLSAFPLRRKSENLETAFVQRV